MRKRWGGGGGGGRGVGDQNIFLGPPTKKRVEGNIETFSTRVRSREKEYESEITVVVDQQIPSDDFFWYYNFWGIQNNLKFVGGARLSRPQTHHYYLLKMLSGNF